MCNLYSAGPSPNTERHEWEKQVRTAVDGLQKPQIAKTDPGVVVVRAESGQLEARTMRWGYHRSFADGINNARDDKLEGGMWRDSWHHRRCLIPARWYFEWHQTLKTASGRKQCLRIQANPDGWMWMAGIWEEDPRMGHTYSMLTTSPGADMARIHSRIPAILRESELLDYLRPGPPPRQLIRAFPEPLQIDAVESPLLRKKKSG